jgi:hypothetical protein
LKLHPLIVDELNKALNIKTKEQLLPILEKLKTQMEKSLSRNTTRKLKRNRTRRVKIDKTVEDMSY